MPSQVSARDGGQTVEDLRRELAEAREQQTATAEVLAAISSSPSNVQTALNMVAESAARLCSADDAAILQVDAGLLRLVAHHGPIPTGPRFVTTMPLVRGALVGRAVLERRWLHVADLAAESTEYPEGSDAAKRLGFRTTLAAPLIRGGESIGVISIRRAEVRGFTDRQIALLKTFADQAAIAIANAHLLTELKESLEYQVAASEVLPIILRSSALLQPVLDAIVEKAARLCRAEYAFVYRLKDDKFQLVSSNNAEAEHAKYIARHPPDLNRGSVAGRAALDRVTVHLADALTDPQYTRTESQRRGAYRSLLGIPLLRDGVPMGVLVLLRTQVAPFTDKQIELVTNFANQAVIAIENTRLVNELREALRQQTATSDMLKALSRTAFDLQMVLDTLIRSATELCGAKQGVLRRLEGEHYPLAATYGMNSEWRNLFARHRNSPGRATLVGRVKSLPIGIGDEQRLTQVLLNLVGNAIKFTDTGEVCVIAKAVNGQFNVSVTDTGPGIPTEHQMRIFEQFHQVDSSNTKAKGGTGLGLAIAKQIVEMHGGRIWVESTLGKGSTFQMELPIRAEFRKRTP